MFLGHFAAGLIAKKVNRKPSLGTYFLAAQFLDLLWPTLLLLNLEQVEITPGKTEGVPLTFTHYPISHSLLAVVGWAFLFGCIYWLIRKNKNAAIVLSICVVSHWVLDLIVHIPDLPLYPGNSPLYGLGLWRSMPVTLIIELLLFGIGIFMYTSATTAVNKKGIYVFWSLAIFLLIVHFANVFGPPPPGVKSIAWAGHLQWLFVFWAYWADANKSARKIETVKASGSFANG